MKRILSAAMYLVVLAGCTTGRAIFTVSGEPGSSELLKQRSISTATEQNASMMSKNLEQTLIQELKRSHYHYTPGKSDIVIKVSADHGGRNIEGSYSYVPIWGGVQTNHDQMELINLDFQASQNGKPFWEARISGNGEYLLGNLQGGCIRELLLNHTHHSETREDRCYKDSWPPR